MQFDLKVFGIDGDDAAELEELLWSIPEISDVTTRFRARDSVSPGTIHASISGTVMTCAFMYVAMKVADEAIKDVYKAAKTAIMKRLIEWQDAKNAALEPQHRIYFTLSADGEYIVQRQEDTAQE